MNNLVNIIIKIIFIKLFYDFLIYLFLNLDEIIINDIQLLIIKNYIDKIMKFIIIIKNNYIIIKIIQTYNINKSQYSNSIYKISDIIMLDFRNIYYYIKKNNYLIKFYFHFLNSFKIIKIKFKILNYKLKLLFKINFISIYSNFHISLL